MKIKEIKANDRGGNSLKPWVQLVFSRDIEEVSSSANPPTRNTKANAIPFNMKSVQQSTTTTSIPFMKEFLNYNRINLEDVTLERGEQIFKKYREYFELSAIRQAEGIIEEQCKSLAKTQYSFPAELGSVKRRRVSFILR